MNEWAPNLWTPNRPNTGDAGRDRGAAVVLDNAGAWRAAALDAIEQLARECPEFTADDVRERGTEQPHHANAWGAAMLTAARNGWIRATDRTRKSVRAAAHAHRNPIWESLLINPGVPR